MFFIIRNHWCYATGLCVVLSVSLIRSQDVGFPESGDEEPSRQNAGNRVPVYSPKKCKENELLYPGDRDNDWICDCSPAHLFHPGSDKCYAAYRQGPCAPTNYLVLAKTETIPACRKNPCENDGYVRVNDKCYELGKPGPCPMPELNYVLAVNVTTLDLTCVRLLGVQTVPIADRFNTGEDQVTSTTPIPNYISLNDIPLCAKGCKRFINGWCPAVKSIRPGGRYLGRHL